MGIGAVGWFVPRADGLEEPVLVTWLIVLALFTLFTLVVGHGVTGRWRGALISETNRMSLSRLQLLLWTILVVATFIAMALFNLQGEQVEPLTIKLPGELWIILGISATSLVGSPLLLAPKAAAGSSNQMALSRTRTLLGEKPVDTSGNRITTDDESKVVAIGQLLANKSIDDASWGDVFKGDEVGNGAHLDLSKLQMFFFTLIIVLAYAVAIGQVFEAAATKVDAFPVLDPGVLALLGISHAGYLANKAVPHTPPDPVGG
jgi:hypothetical protein